MILDTYFISSLKVSKYAYANVLSQLLIMIVDIGYVNDSIVQHGAVQIHAHKMLVQFRVPARPRC